MKNITLISKVVVSIEENLADDYDNQGKGLLIDDSVSISLGQIYEDDGTFRDMEKSEMIDLAATLGKKPVKTKASLSGLLSVMTQEEKTALYTLKGSDIDVQIYMDEFGDNIDICDNPLFVEKSIMTQERLDEISGFTKLSNSIKGIEEPAE